MADKSPRHQHRCRFMRKISRRILPLSMALCAAAPAAVPPALTATTFTVVNNNDSGPGSLRQAILDAVGGDTVNFAANQTGAITLLSGELTIGRRRNPPVRFSQFFGCTRGKAMNYPFDELAEGLAQSVTGRPGAEATLATVFSTRQPDNSSRQT